MAKTILMTLLVLASPIWLQAQSWSWDKFTANMGGGVTTPLNPTGAYAGLSGNFLVGAGYKMNKNDAIVGEFLWTGLPSNRLVLDPVRLPNSNINLYSLTANYRHQFDRIHGSPFGMYFMAGGGWYQRYIAFEKDYVVPPFVPCQPYYYWWGYGCGGDGYVVTQTVASKGVSAGGLNGGLGFTIRLADSNLRFFMESRYHYGFSERIPTTFVPVTFGFRYN